MRNRVESFDFSILIADVEDLTERIAAELAMAGCADAQLSSTMGVVKATFHREAQSLQDAIATASLAIRQAGYEPGRVEAGIITTAPVVWHPHAPLA